jgi:hypothetical protein
MYSIRKILSENELKDQNWTVNIQPPGGDWELLGNSIMPLTDEFILIFATFEHHRGGVQIDIHRLIDSSGKVYWQKELNFFNTCVTDDSSNRLFVIERSFSMLSIPGYTGFELMVFDFIKAEEISKVNLIYPMDKLNPIQRQKAETLSWFPATASFHLESGQAGIRLSPHSNAPEELKNLDAHVINFSDLLMSDVVN